MPHVQAVQGKIIQLDNNVTVDQWSSINVDVTLPLAAAALAAGNIVQLDAAAAPTWPAPSGRASSSDALTAHAGGGQANGTQLPSKFNRFTTVATAADSAALPKTNAAATPGTGLELFVVNAGANSMNVFPSAGEAINALAADAAYALAAGKTAHFICTGLGRWHAILSA